MSEELKAKIDKLEAKAAALLRRKKAIMAAMSRDERKRRTRAKIIIGAAAVQLCVDDLAVLSSLSRAVQVMPDRDRDLVLSIYPKLRT